MVNVRSKMSEEKRNNTRQIVSSVGNSWVVTQSKSHPGYVYYFNTTTGEAVWNLGDVENEKAALKRQESEPGSKFFACPEPKDKPPTQRPLKNPFNQNNRLDQQQNPTFTIIQQQQQSGEMFRQHPEMNIVQTQQQSTSVYPDLPMNNLTSFDLNALSNQINAYNVISTPSVFTPNSWPIPRTQQIIITPTIPLVNQAQSHASLNVAYNQLKNDDHITSSRFNNFQSSPDRRKRLLQPRNNFVRGNQRNQSLSFLNANDLRQQLYLKRRMNNIAYQRKSILVSEEIENNTNESASAITSNAKTPAVSSYIENIIEEESISHKKKEKLDINMTGTPLRKEGSPSKLDLTPLKSLAPSTARLDSLYIVVDLRVLLDEFNLLNAMADSDECCQLVVPDNVMSDLKDYISCSNNIPARCIFRSLSQLIQNSCAFVAGKCNQDYGHTITNPILKTCLQLFEENVHVILLAKDNELLNCKKFIRINIFNVEEVKSLINWEPLKCPPKVPSVSHLSNIPAPNTSPFNAKPLQRKITVIEAPIEDTMIEGDDPVTVISDKEETNAVTAVLPVKNTSDAAIQTETVTVISYDTNTDSLDGQIQNIPEIANNTKILKESLNESNNTVRTSLPNKKREIKLKRNISNQPLQSTSTVKSNEKKPFRWRRYRNSNLLVSTTHNNDKPCTVTQNDLTVASVQIDATIGTEKQSDEIPNNKHEMEQQSTDIVESSGSTINCVNIRKENITIEETSTSGIISNTESNVDADIEYRTFDDNRHDKSKDIQPKMVKYDIDSESMEESLKTKCEEWISRFVQIMEEVLAVVLHKEAAFSNIEFPPPWSLHEAAQCIGKYCNNASVKHVTDRLSRILFDLSDHAGKICVNMTPSQYMEMYSCSVSLLNEIKAITTCEDIDIAEESLQKLLADIKNSCYDCTDSIIDLQEDSQNKQITNIDSEQTDFESPKRNNSSYNLRSGRLKKVLDKPAKVCLDTKSAFFSNLSLIKVKSANTTDNVNTSCGSPANERTELSSSNGEDKDNQLNRINIVRNFTKCAELEEKLKNKLNTNTIEDNKEYLDYENDYKYTSADCRSNECNMSDEGSVISNPNVTQAHDTSDVSENIVANSANTVDPSLASNSNNTFKLMICLFLDEVGKAIKEVKVLCDKCYAELKRPQLPAKERNELENQVENAHCNIVGICFSLGGMLSRDPNAPYDNIRTALMKAGINISQIDRNLILEYWKTIASCKKNVDDILNSIHEIMTAFKT